MRRINATGLLAVAMAGIFCTGFIANFPFARLSSRGMMRPAMSSKQVTYRPSIIPSSSSNEQLLVKDDEMEVINTIDSWKSEVDVENELITTWINNGQAFWANPEGVRAIHIAEKQRRSNEPRESPKRRIIAANVYVEKSSEV